MPRRRGSCCAVRACGRRFAHGADIGIRGRAETRDRAFAEAACALTAVVTDLESVAATAAVEVRCEAPDDELLLVEWLNALIYEMAIRKMLFGRFEVRITGHAARGDGVGRARRGRAPSSGGRAERRDHDRRCGSRREPDGTWLAQTVVDV